MGGSSFEVFFNGDVVDSLLGRRWFAAGDRDYVEVGSVVVVFLVFFFRYVGRDFKVKVLSYYYYYYLLKRVFIKVVYFFNLGVLLNFYCE